MPRDKSAPSIDGYEILALLGKGAMGHVFKARQVAMNRTVALKVIDPKFSQDASYVDRFLREARSVGRLNHPRIVHGYDAGACDDQYYISMEFVDGESLDRVLDRLGILGLFRFRVGRGFDLSDNERKHFCPGRQGHRVH